MRLTRGLVGYPGGTPDGIDRTAQAMGVAPEEYVLASYRELHEERARARGEQVGDLVFGAREEDRT